MAMNLLLVIAFPEGEPYLDANVDAEMLADVIVNDMNEDRRRNADEAGRPDYYKPVMVHAIPAPQWVDGQGLAILVRAIQLVQACQEPLAAPTPEPERCPNPQCQSDDRERRPLVSVPAIVPDDAVVWRDLGPCDHPWHSGGGTTNQEDAT